VRAPSASTPDFISAGRFVPGTLLASRYRVVAMLGEGGMGEVYRADDLTLGHTVALKFLPAGIAADADRLARFRAEVRMARQVSHPNVCRVYDIVETDGLHFISMEYIDGEDLASLLRRIGRLPQDKGIEIGRQICAGLAAAHDRGILHRDLKPANVMIDGRGHARLADFGIAAAAGIDRGDRLAGTPAYLAPELLAGQPPTIQSDLYSLGLVLHEIFTGKPVFAPGDLLDIVKAQRARTTPRATTTAADLDPAIDRVIARCLEAAPDARPTSALAIAAALPGGDPLAAALARGETPAPELVAAAGGEGALRPAVAGIALMGLLVTFGVHLWVTEQTSLLNVVPMPLRPEVLRDRAEQLIHQVGYTDSPVDVATGFDVGPYVLYLVGRPEPGPPWERAQRGQPSAVRFWYRRAAAPLVADRLASRGRVSLADPSQRDDGMITVYLDTKGRLLRFSAVPERDRIAQTDLVEPNWASMFAAAGFDTTQFREVPSHLAPEADADVRRAWEGVYPDSPDIPIRIEAAAATGRPIYFRVIEPWADDPASLAPPAAAMWTLLLLIAAAVSLGVWLAARNLRLGRGDATGATRVGIAVFALATASGLLETDTYLYPGVPRDLAVRLTIWIGSGTAAGLMYLALEPPLRRRWPHLLIGWSRLMRGRWRDPRVGREILIGVLVASIQRLLPHLPVLLAQAAGIAPSLAFVAYGGSRAELDGGQFLAADLFAAPVAAALMAFLVLLVLFALTFVVRKPWIAAVVIGAVLVWSNTALSSTPVREAPFMIVGFILLFTVLLRVGLLAYMTVHAVIWVLEATVLTVDPSAWYAMRGWVVMGIVLTLAIYGFRTSLGGRPLFSGRVLEE
jgi:serine/threonine-protein kinase